MKKIITTLLLISSCLSIGGCTNETPNNPPKDDDNDNNNPVVETDKNINIYLPLGYDKGAQLTSLVNEYNQELLDGYEIKIVHETSLSDPNYVKTALEKDITIFLGTPTHIQEFSQQQSLANLYDFVHNPDYGFTEAELDNFIPAFYEEGYKAYGYTQDDRKLSSLPLSKYIDVLYINLSKLSELFPSDISFNPLPLTWEEMWDAAQNVSNKLDSNDGLTISSIYNFITNYTTQKDYGWINATEPSYAFTNQETTTWLTQLQDYYNNNYFNTLYTNNLQNSPYIIGSSTSFSFIANGCDEGDQVIVKALPQADVLNPKYTYTGESLAIVDRLDNQKEEIAFKFLKQLFSTDFQCEFSRSNFSIPVIESVLDNQEYQTWLTSDIQGSITAVALSIKDSYVSTPALLYNLEVSRNLTTALDDILNGNMDPKEALEIVKNNLEK